MTVLSTSVSALLGVPLGILIATRKFLLRNTIRRILQTSMSLPPVVAGLLVFLLLSRQGPFGQFRLLFSLPAMVLAQCLLIIPVISSLTCSAVEKNYKSINDTLLTFGQPVWKIYLLQIRENRNTLITVLLTGFGRAISEVGAVMMVGGNIEGKTRVLTTAIMLETNRGNFGTAILLGLILMLMALIVNSIATRFQEKSNV
jgi:tungstate transport system permease protein